MKRTPIKQLIIQSLWRAVQWEESLMAVYSKDTAEYKAAERKAEEFKNESARRGFRVKEIEGTPISIYDLLQREANKK